MADPEQGQSSAEKPGDEIYANARKDADENQQKKVAKSKKVAEKFERLLQNRLKVFFRIEVSLVGLCIFSLIIACISYSFSSISPYIVYPIPANIAIIIVAIFGAGLSFYPNSFDKTQYILTVWLAFYLVTFIFSIVAEVFLVLQAIYSYATCTSPYDQDLKPLQCANNALTGLVGFNCVLFFIILTIRGVTLWTGTQLYQLLTTTKNAVVRAQAKIDTRRSLSNRRRASIHTVDGSERIVEPLPRSPIPNFQPNISSTSLLVESYQPDQEKDENAE